jgi:tetratricopeptide (TPR) repeat protein
MDDEASIVDNKLIRDVSSVGTILTSSFFGEGTYYRPVVSLSFLLEYHLFKLNPFFYCLTNLLLHLGSAATLFFVFDILLKKRALSFAGAVLFAVHPLQWEAVSNIAGRSILLCAFGYFFAFWMYLKFIEDKRRQGHYLGAFLAYLLALLSKESAVTFPLVLVSYEILVNRQGRGRADWKEALCRFAPFFIWTAAYLLLRRALGITNIGFWPSAEMLALAVLTFFRSLLTGLRSFVFPVDLHFDRAHAYFTSFLNPEVWAVVVVLVLALTVFARLRRNMDPLVQFFLAWFFLSLLPVAQLFPLPAHSGYAAAADHFFYTALPGLTAISVLAADFLFSRAKARGRMSAGSIRFFCAGVFLYLGIMTFGQDMISSQELAMFEQSLKFNPFNTRVRSSYALALAKRGLFKEAEEEFRVVLSQEPWDARARIGLAKSMCDQGKCLDAIREYEGIADAGSLQEILERNLKHTYEAVIRQYARRIALDSQNSRLYYSLGVVYAKQGKLLDALREYRKALVLDPRCRHALFNLGAGLETGGDLDEAAGYFERLVALGEEDLLTELAYRHLEKISRRRADAAAARAYRGKREAMKGQGQSQE